MVKLIVSDFGQVTILEDALVRANIPHIVEIGEPNPYIGSPILIVDGVCLDLCAALTWVAEHQN